MTYRLGMAPTRRGVLAACAGLAAGLPGRAIAESDALLTRPIPHTGEALPAVGLGTAVAYDIGDDAAERAARAGVIRALVGAGGTLIDTAPSYGRAEAVVGDLIAGAGLRERIFLATKLEAYDRGSGPTELRASLRRLRADRLDLMQLHNVRDPQQDLAMLREWKAQGRCRYTGITTTFHGSHAAAEAILRREKPDFLQIDYSLDDREAESRILPAAAEIGAAVLTALPFGRGRLFRGVRGQALPDWAQPFAAGWAPFFLKYLLSDPRVTAVIA